MIHGATRNREATGHWDWQCPTIEMQTHLLRSSRVQILQSGEQTGTLQQLLSALIKAAAADLGTRKLLSLEQQYALSGSRKQQCSETARRTCSDNHSIPRFCSWLTRGWTVTHG